MSMVLVYELTLFHGDPWTDENSIEEGYGKG